jgi:hypothetical protein
MLYTLTNVQKADGNFGPTITCTATGVDNTVIQRATIYKKQKDGTEFPNFDTLAEGSKLEANPWTNPKGYTSLFPPRAPSVAAPRRSPAAITKAMETKAENIHKAQEFRSEGVRTSATMRDAVNIVVSMNAKGDMTGEQIRAGIQAWRKWLWFQWEAPESYPPFENTAGQISTPTSPKTAPGDMEPLPDDNGAAYDELPPF